MAIGDEGVAGVLAKALDLYIAQKLKDRFGMDAKAPKAKATPVTEPTTTKDEVEPQDRNRAIPVAVKRAVIERDGTRCAYVGTRGRCKQTRRLELHHIEPYATGGKHTVENVSVRCRAHNLMHTRDELGAGFVARKVAEQRARLKHGAPGRRNRADAPGRQNQADAARGRKGDARRAARPAGCEIYES